MITIRKKANYHKKALKEKGFVIIITTYYFNRQKMSIPFEEVKVSSFLTAHSIRFDFFFGILFLSSLRYNSMMAFQQFLKSVYFIRWLHNSKMKPFNQMVCEKFTVSHPFFYSSISHNTLRTLTACT